VTLVALLSGCSSLLPGGAVSPTGGGQPDETPALKATAATSPSAVGVPVSALDKQWAVQALQVLDTFEAGVKDYHDATQFPQGSPQRQQLTRSAYSRFQQAAAAHELLLPVTRRVQDTQDRDQYMFVLGNVGGFLTPTPDLPADPPSLGDRISRSLDNAIAASSAVRPKLERLAKS
jgi:hypothetical protein